MGFILFFMIPLLIGVELVVLKLALKATKAQQRTSFKWVFISFIIQISFFGFIAVPFILLGTGGFLGDFGAFVPFMIGILIFYFFLEINLINVLHNIGLKGATIVFILLVVPIFIIGALIGGIISIASNMYYEAQRPPGSGYGGYSLVLLALSFF